MEGFAIFVLIVSLLAVPVLALGMIVRIVNKSPAWKSWGKMCLTAVVSVLISGPIASSLYNKKQALEKAQEAAQNEPHDAYIACVKALEDAGGGNWRDILGYPPAADMDAFNDHFPTKQPDGSYTVTSVRTGPGDVSGGLKSRWEGQCSVRDGQVTILHGYALAGSEPYTEN